MGKELEWKYTVAGKDLQDEILQWQPVQARMAGPLRQYHMQSSYYDTPERLLGKLRCTLRRRLENERSVICVKAPLPEAEDPNLHGEWELEGEDLSQALPELVRAGAPQVLLQTATLLCVAKADFFRRAADLQFADGSRSELAMDLGTLSGPTESMPLCEMELELKAGDPAASEAFLRQLADCFSLEKQSLSKYARARSLG